jgi:hypothetical protein
VHRGSHYSNGKGLTKVLHTAENPPIYETDFLATIEEAM